MPLDSRLRGNDVALTVGKFPAAARLNKKRTPCCVHDVRQDFRTALLQCFIASAAWEQSRNNFRIQLGTASGPACLVVTYNDLVATANELEISACGATPHPFT